MAKYKEKLQSEKQGEAFCQKVGKIEKIPPNEKQGLVLFKTRRKTPRLTFVKKSRDYMLVGLKLVLPDPG